MNAAALDELHWLVAALEGLLQCGACVDCITDLGVFGVDREIIEAANEDADRAYRALRRILEKYNALPDWEKLQEGNPKDDPGTDVEIPF